MNRNPLLPKSEVLHYLTSDDFSRQRETPWGLKGLPHFYHKQVYQSHFFFEGGGEVGKFYAVEFFLGVLLSC